MTAMCKFGFVICALQNGIDVRTAPSMLGHSSAGFTLATYTHAASKVQEQAAAKMGSLLAAGTLLSHNSKGWASTMLAQPYFCKFSIWVKSGSGAFFGLPGWQILHPNINGENETLRVRITLVVAAEQHNLP